ncbi:MAG TPA: RidA family protein [Phenylobacterium sp.]|jgi:2-iminobutanoate/2-iminopropanoate deaminase|nr:RidA family protein [Phenylobacterium sp.]
MSRTIVSAHDGVRAPSAYSHAVRCAGLVFVSGTAAYDATGQIVGETIQEQTAQALRNIAAILKAAGTTLDRAVSATVIVADENDFAGMNEEWVRWFPTDPPARQGAKLPVRTPRLKVSIAMIAEAS